MSSETKFSLSWLVNPITPEMFFNKYWENEVLLLSRNNEAYWNGLLSLEVIDNVISSLNLEYPDLCVAKANENIPKEQYLIKGEIVNVSKIYQYFGDGHTIILNHLHDRLPVMAHLCRSMEFEFSMPFQTNIYLTPKNAQGFKAHYDAHCVFIIQVHGKKRWRIYQKALDRPTKDHHNIDSTDEYGAPTMEFDLNPGDLVYIPRGVVHEAVTSDDQSMHITLGALAYTWADTLPDILRTISLADSEFRKSLPIGFANNNYDQSEAKEIYLRLINKLCSEQIFSKVFNTAIDRFVSSRKPILDGQLSQIRKTKEINVNDHVVPRPNVIYSLRVLEEAIHINCYGNLITFPINLYSSVLFVLNSKRFSVKEIPSEIDLELKRLIVHKLVNAGIVRFEN